MRDRLELRDTLAQYLSRFESLAVAFSGGVDSSVLLKAAHTCLDGKVLAITGSTPYTHSSETDNARRIAEEIGVPIDILSLSPADNIYDNPADRCYICKKELFSGIIAHAQKKGFDTLAEGTIYDDRSEHRPGLKALRELEVASPLNACAFTKSEVRNLAREYGLSNHEQPSYTCLLTRFPVDWHITKEELEKVGKAEELLRDAGFSQVRLRHHGNTARIETDPEKFSQLIELGTRRRIIFGIKKLGYDFVTLDLEGYRFGSMEKKE